MIGTRSGKVQRLLSTSVEPDYGDEEVHLSPESIIRPDIPFPQESLNWLSTKLVACPDKVDRQPLKSFHLLARHTSQIPQDHKEIAAMGDCLVRAPAG